MDERRRYKNAKDEQGKTQLRNKVQRRSRKAQNNGIDGKCKEVETLFSIGKIDAAHRKTKENFRPQRVNANIVRNNNDKVLTGSRDKVSRWVE